MNNENAEKGGKWSLTCGILLAIFGGILTIVSGLFEVFVLVAAGKVPLPTGTAEYNQYYMLGVYLGTYCVLPPFILLGIILLVVGIWLVRRKPKS
jgi:hypothetical protein